MEKTERRNIAVAAVVCLGLLALAFALTGCAALQQQTKIVDKPSDVMLRTLEEETVEAEYIDKETGELRSGKYRVPARCWIVSPEFVEGPDSSTAQLRSKTRAGGSAAGGGGE